VKRRSQTPGAKSWRPSASIEWCAAAFKLPPILDGEFSGKKELTANLTAERRDSGEMEKALTVEVPALQHALRVALLELIESALQVGNEFR
jgi:hypothetical protein